jgi:hypothetical protein
MPSVASKKQKFYRRSRPENLDEIEHILILMSVDDEFVRFVSPLLSDLSILPEVPAVVRVARWIVEFNKRNKRAPREYLQKIFEEQEDRLDEADAELTKKLLARLNEKYLQGGYEDVALQHELDRAEKYLQKRALAKNNAESDAALKNDSVEEAVEIKERFVLPSLTSAAIGINLGGDPQELEKLDSKKEEDGLFHLPGDLGFKVGPVYRGDLWAFLAAMKVGKTWWLSKVARMALDRGLNVFFASLEMSMRKMVFRFTQPLLNMVKVQDKGRVVRYPYFSCRNNVRGRRCRKKIDQYAEEEICTLCSRSINWKVRANFSPSLEYRDMELRENPILNVDNSVHALGRFRKRIQQMSGGSLYINSYAPRTTTVEQVYSDMKQIESYRGIKFDVFISDYADNFRDQGEYRHQLHEIWSKHKGIGLDENMAVFTASQSNTAREDGKRVTGGSWAEDIRKKGIIDVGIGLDASDKERENQCLQANIIANRDLYFNSKQLITVLNCYQIGKVHLGSWVLPEMQED